MLGYVRVMFDQIEFVYTPPPPPPPPPPPFPPLPATAQARTVQAELAVAAGSFGVANEKAGHEDAESLAPQ